MCSLSLEKSQTSAVRCVKASWGMEDEMDVMGCLGAGGMGWDGIGWMLVAVSFVFVHEMGCEEVSGNK